MFRPFMFATKAAGPYSGWFNQVVRFCFSFDSRIKISWMGWKLSSLQQTGFIYSRAVKFFFFFFFGKVFKTWCLLMRLLPSVFTLQNPVCVDTCAKAQNCAVGQFTSKLVFTWMIHVDFVVFSERRAFKNEFPLHDLAVPMYVTIQQCHALISGTYW